MEVRDPAIGGGQRPGLQRELLRWRDLVAAEYIAESPGPDRLAAAWRLLLMRATEPRLHCLHRPGKLGLGTAYVDGFRWALARDYDFIYEMDADFSHDPASLPEFIRVAEETPADLVLGSRYLNGVTVVNWPLSRLILSYGANVYTRLITWMPVNDATGGFKCFRRRVLDTLDLDRVHSDGYGFQIEMSFKAWRRGFRLKEIPITFTDRRVGISKMNKKIIWEAMWLVWWLRLSALLGRI